MNISLSPELEKFVQNKIHSGLYSSASEVIRESLRLMYTHDNLQQQKIQQLNQEIEIGLQQLSDNRKVDGETSRRRLTEKLDSIVKEKHGK